MGFTPQHQTNILIQTLQQRIKSVYEDAIGGKLLPGYLCLEHQTLIAFSREGGLSVVLLAFTDEPSTPPVQANIQIEHFYLIAPVPDRDAKINEVANALVKHFLNILGARNIRGSLGPQPYNPFYKRVIL